ncbi:hypothetical protein KFL_011850010 [Klebsormidium nitens]|uniref:SF3 helicase domain-containing protein n=1 Tax=Klebsormidium nitens TaxID=105231 RepID=A0A1Y1IQE1_KLENI|nr:hypothetical protein KFL_011850010 [Klebsormidium nitens]|eukprot:GAQ92893.1 hypothetical protein KFL_011850010 [Klebsormidium nitens]
MVLVLKLHCALRFGWVRCGAVSRGADQCERRHVCNVHQSVRCGAVRCGAVLHSQGSLNKDKCGILLRDRKMGLYEPSSPVFFGPRSPKGLPKQPANKKRQRHITESANLEDTAASGQRHNEEMQVAGNSKEKGGGSPDASAHKDGCMHVVEGGAADGAQMSGLACSSPEEGGGSPGANACMDENGGVGNAESSADTSCNLCNVPIGVVADPFGWQNGNGQGQEGRRGGTPAESGAKDSSEPASPFGESDLADPELRSEVVRELEKLLSTWGDNTSVFCAVKPSSMGTGVIYEFRNAPDGRTTCPYFAATCEGVHVSDGFGLLRQGVEVMYVCYAQSCKAASRSGNIRIGVLPLPIGAAFGDSQPLNSERNHLYSDRQLLPLPFLRENLNVKKGDVGGAIILERLYVRTGLKFAFTSSGSYYWTGRCWAKDESGGRILRVLREELSNIEAAYMREAGQGEGGRRSIAMADGPAGDGDSGLGVTGGPRISSKPAGGGKQPEVEREERRINVNFNAKMSNIMGTCKEYFYQPGFQSLLDVQKDFLAVANGVIDLRTGELLLHHPRFMNSRVIDWPYPRAGLSFPRCEMVGFLEDIMHASGEDGPAALEHLQVLLGYGLTGHTSNQVLPIFVGEGSAGKSVFLALLRKLLGAAFRDVGKEILVNSKGQRAAHKGAASPLEAGLAGALLAVVEETDKSDTLNEAGMKKLTGSDVITARPLFKDFITFTATVLLIICTNYLPRTDETWSVALRRRLQLVCFVRRYFSPHEKGYDPTNPLHGLVDTRLLTKLSTLQNMQELLAWLVAGAVKWYQNGQQLFPMPRRSTDALQDYEEAADDFDNFVLNSCVKGDDLFISTSDALKAYNDPQRMVGGKCVGHIPSLDTKSLKSAMNNHGFSGPDKPSKLGLGVKYCGVTERGYKGLALKAPEVKME